MTSSVLDSLLTRLHAGDAAAAEQICVMYEPMLRMVVRRQLSEPLQSKLDSTDVVQSVWADVLSGFRGAKWSFRDTNHLRAFLIAATRNRLVDRFRRHRAAIAHEQSMSQMTVETLGSTPLDRASEMAQANELWQQILDVCPPAHVELLRLKRQGLSLAEVAARTGLHEGSVRRILCDVARRLARKQASGDADA